MVETRAPRLTAWIAIAIAIASSTIALPRAAAQSGDLASSDESTASDAPPVEPSRPWFVGGGLGVGVRLDGFVPAAFRIVEEAGLHFEGTPVGPFVALMLAEDIASYFSLQIGVRVGWDLELLRRPDFSIVVSPSLGIAFALDAGTATGEWAYFLVQPALGAGVLLIDRMLALWIRPIGVDVYIGEQVHGGWAALVGATVAL